MSSNMYKKLLGVGLGSALALSGAYLVSPYEGLVNKTYVDPVGILTVCYGTTGSKAVKGKIYTDDECLEQLASGLVQHDKEMMNAISVPITDFQHAAFLSFTYNVGVTNFKRSSMLVKLNKGDYIGACKELPKWVYAKGKVLQGLVKRRQSEMKMCLGELDEINKQLAKTP
ncbi:Phage lysozyme [compost metagenome]